MYPEGYAESSPNGRFGRSEEVLGIGSYKTMYKAFDEESGTEVAWTQVKLRDFEAREKLALMHEVELLRRLDHPNIIRFHESWTCAGEDTDASPTLNYITELCSSTLRDYSAMYRRVDMRAIRHWVRQILNGLVYLHSQEPAVIHRDVKLANIFINGNSGEVKIGDLGLAHTLGVRKVAHTCVGTPEYMAPELYEEEYDCKVDIYSFGMCVLELETHEFPYSECGNMAQIYKKVSQGILPASLEKLTNPEMRRFIMRCLSPKEERPIALELLQDEFLTASRRQAPSAALETAEEARSVSDEAVRVNGQWHRGDSTVKLRFKVRMPAGTEKTVEFPFVLTEDTAEAVARELVSELDLPSEEQFVAALIEQIRRAVAPAIESQEQSTGAEAAPAAYPAATSRISQGGAGGSIGALVAAGGGMPSDLEAFLSQLSLSAHGPALRSSVGITHLSDLAFLSEAMLKEELPALKPVERARLLSAAAKLASRAVVDAPAAPSSGPDVMLSYRVPETGAGGDGSVFALQKALESRGYSVFVGEAAIEGGASWPDTIQRGVEDCRAFVVICSETYGDSEKSPWTKRELVTADALKKPIIPVWHSGRYPPNPVMMYLMEKQRIPAGNYRNGYAAAQISNDQVAEELAAALQRAGVPRRNANANTFFTLED